eukprot:Skav221420  [mRNA]  locus=scaffold1064:188096:189532:- [translate_table: standard]
MPWTQPLPCRVARLAPLSEGKRFYIILSMRNFNRGPPMLPSDSDDDGVTVSISGGEAEGAGYFQCFLKRLGYADIDLWSTLDGRVLVPYQCVMPRSQWEDVKEAWTMLGCALGVV